MYIEFFGATQEVTGSCFMLTIENKKILVDCGMIQGSSSHERHNYDPFPFSTDEIDAVILTHAHLDHSGRIPLLVKRGFNGPIYAHKATVDLCDILFQDAGFLNEKDARWQNKIRNHDAKDIIEPLFTKEEAKYAMRYFKPLDYSQFQSILPGINVTLHDAGHILGSSIVELDLQANGQKRRVVFSGDLGHLGAPILRDPTYLDSADLVIMESTYGDRLHRNWSETWQEMGEIFNKAQSEKGNILIPAFAVGRTQELLYTFKRHFEEWNIGDWDIFLDSPMAIESTKVYAKHSKIYDLDASEAKQENGSIFDLPNLHMTSSTEQSLKINQVKSGAIIIAGSGMCTGGRIKHHFDHNIWRDHAHVIIVGFQARGTLGRKLVDGMDRISLWKKSVPVRASVHTIGGLSAHADQQGLINWFLHFKNKPDLVLVHGEPEAMNTLASEIAELTNAKITKASYRQKILL